MQRTDAAGDIEPDTARRDHTALVRIESGHPADGKSITPVRIWHGARRLHDAWETGDVGDLLEYLLVHGLDQVLVGEDNARHTHPATRLDTPLVAVHPGQFLKVHCLTTNVGPRGRRTRSRRPPRTARATTRPPAAQPRARSA